jgi:Flp pilus assembly protein TadB
MDKEKACLKEVIQRTAGKAGVSEKGRSWQRLKYEFFIKLLLFFIIFIILFIFIFLFLLSFFVLSTFIPTLFCKTNYKKIIVFFDNQVLLFGQIFKNNMYFLN